MHHVMDGEIGQQIFDAFTANDFVGMAFYDDGSRSFRNPETPIRSMADLTGMKFCVMQSDMFVDIVGALGANATPCALRRSLFVNQGWAKLWLHSASDLVVASFGGRMIWYASEFAAKKAAALSTSLRFCRFGVGSGRDPIRRENTALEGLQSCWRMNGPQRVSM